MGVIAVNLPGPKLKGVGEELKGLKVYLDMSGARVLKGSGKN